VARGSIHGDQAHPEDLCSRGNLDGQPGSRAGRQDVDAIASRDGRACQGWRQAAPEPGPTQARQSRQWPPTSPSTHTAVAEGQTSNGGAANWGYYGLKRMATTAKEPAIFIAPQSQGSTWQQSDHALFDDILAMAKESLCIDASRVFATGFSFGGMITYSLSLNHQKDLRGAVGNSPGELQHLSSNRQPPAHGVDEHNRYERWHLSLGWGKQPRREVYRHRARQRQRVYYSGHHTHGNARQQVASLLRLPRVQTWISRERMHLRWRAYCGSR
jgi:hypothetical protein